MAHSRIKNNHLKASNNMSDKQSRAKANRKLRRITRELLAKGEEFLPLLRDVSDTWDFPSDGLAVYCGLEIQKYYKYYTK